MRATLAAGARNETARLVSTGHATVVMVAAAMASKLTAVSAPRSRPRRPLQFEVCGINALTSSGVTSRANIRVDVLKSIAAYNFATRPQQGLDPLTVPCRNKKLVWGD